MSLGWEGGPGNLCLGLRATPPKGSVSREDDKGRRRKSFHLKLVDWLVTSSPKVRGSPLCTGCVMRSSRLPNPTSALTHQELPHPLRGAPETSQSLGWMPTPSKESGILTPEIPRCSKIPLAGINRACFQHPSLIVQALSLLSPEGRGLEPRAPQPRGPRGAVGPSGGRPFL